MSAIAPPVIHHHHCLHRHSFSPSSSFRPTHYTLCLIKRCVFKPRSSLQTHNKPSQQPRHSPPPSPNSPPWTSDTSFPQTKKQGASDPELRAVLELATGSELFELETILFGPSYLSPLLKSITNGVNVDRFVVEDDLEEREQFINVLESRFLYLAADARSTLRGSRPSYRNVLLDVRKELNIHCSRKLPTEDLELEIFIHMMHECSRDDTGAALRAGAAELCSVLLRGGQFISFLKISELVSTRFSEKMLLEAAKHKLENEVIKKGFAGAAARALGLRSLASLFGPILWGTFLADVVIQMLGTDYVRILQAIYAFAQIRILRRHGLHLDKLRTSC